MYVMDGRPSEAPLWVDYNYNRLLRINRNLMGRDSSNFEFTSKLVTFVLD